MVPPNHWSSLQRLVPSWSFFISNLVLFKFYHLQGGCTIEKMTEHTEKDVLMKCTKCGYEEEVPRWLIDELFPNEPEENYMMHCPECDHKMIVKK